MADPWDSPQGQTHYLDDGCPGGHREFDPPASIKRLAEAEWKCSDCGGKGFIHNLHNDDGSPIPSGACALCAGTGRIVPFASLRVECVRCFGTTIRNAALVEGVFDGRDCLECGGRGWVPEPDVAKARMVVIATLQQLCGITLTLYRHGEARIDFHGQPDQSVSGSLNTVPFHAAEAWLQEKP